MQPTIKIPEKLQPLYDDTLRYVILEGGRGGAKSHGVAESQLIRGRQRPMLFLDAREIQESIKDSVLSLLEKKIKKLGLEDFYEVQNTQILGKPDKETGERTRFIFSGLKHKIDSIKSIEDVDECWVEEAQTVSEHTWSKLIPTIRKEISPCCYRKLDLDDEQNRICSKCAKIIKPEDVLPSRIVITYNPDLEDDPTYQRFSIAKPTNSKLIKINWRDNPFFPAILNQERLDWKRDNPATYDNVWEGKPKAAVEGAVYAQELQQAKDEDRIGVFPYDDRYPVTPFHDIGWADNTSIVLLQIIDRRFRVIGSYQSQFQRTSHYIQFLQDTGYRFDRIYLPHDADNEHPNADRTWTQIYKSSFPNANVISMERKKIQLRLDSTRNMFPLIDIDRENNKDLLAALARYHYAIDPDTGKTTREPFHGSESNFADAFGYMCIEMKSPSKPKPRKKNQIYAGM